VAETPPAPDPINIDQTEAARLCGLSSKTLERLSRSGEPLGRFRVGNRVLFHFPTLKAWFSARANSRRPEQDRQPT
jgi:phage terminase Nu1 subunit (DNA packaging protein)